MYLYMELPVFVYGLYGFLSWIGGMMLFYKLHRSYIADLDQRT